MEKALKLKPSSSQAVSYAGDTLLSKETHKKPSGAQMKSVKIFLLPHAIQDKKHDEIPTKKHNTMILNKYLIILQFMVNTTILREAHSSEGPVHAGPFFTRY
ncbi:TPA: hypothetical protein RUX67_003088 [Aeromonas dhakensis]|nr:hypothetical protein [Aeromonas dhakensis]